MKLKNKKVIVTGATGFIGANIARRLVEVGADVHILRRQSSNDWRIKDILKKVSVRIVDLLDEEGLKKTVADIKPEIIVHTAVYGSYPFQKDTQRIFNTNIIGTFNLLNASKAVGFELFINTGSSSEYGVKKRAMKEDDGLDPATLYGASKACVTLCCQSFAKTEKLPIATLRLFSPYGYYEEPTRLIPSVILSCLKKETVRVSSPHNVRDFIFIEDVSDLYLKMIENKGKATGEIFNAGFGRQHRVGEVVSEIVKLTGSKVGVEWGSVANPRLEPQRWEANILKSQKFLGWSPHHNLAEGLARTVDWFKKNMKLFA